MSSSIFAQFFATVGDGTQGRSSPTVKIVLADFVGQWPLGRAAADHEWNRQKLEPQFDIDTPGA